VVNVEKRFANEGRFIALSAPRMIKPEISIEATNLTKVYGSLTAIDEVSFDIQKGEVLGFLGPNGAGKSTTMRILCGLVRATSGSATVGGISVVEYPEKVKRLVGYMPENNPLPDELRVVEYLRYRGQLKGLGPREAHARVEEVLELCDLHRKARRQIIGTLSKGFRQRVGIADALLTNPEVVIMDEPTIGLDPHQTKIIRDLINNRRGGMTFVISSHILPEVELCCDRILIINQGRIVAKGTSASLREEYIPAKAFRIKAKAEVEELISELRSLDPEMEISALLEMDEDGFQEFSLKTLDHGIAGEQLLQVIQKNSSWVLREIAEVEASLEEIFLAATKRSWEETLSRKPQKTGIAQMEPQLKEPELPKESPPG
jgi:ABC-2 type transport system ATP-binding protein